MQQQQRCQQIISAHTSAQHFASQQPYILLNTKQTKIHSKTNKAKKKISPVPKCMHPDQTQADMPEGCLGLPQLAP